MFTENLLMQNCQFSLPIFDGGGSAFEMVAGHGEVPAGVVHFNLALAPCTPGQFPLDPDVKSSTTRADFGEGIEAPDDLQGPGFNFPGFRVPALVQVDPGIRVPRRKL